jgi:hypothetical protein
MLPNKTDDAYKPYDPRFPLLYITALGNLSVPGTRMSVAVLFVMAKAVSQQDG